MWCGAALQLCDQHVVDVSEEKAIRYPEQWMYVLWRPTDVAIPFQRPDGWGFPRSQKSTSCPMLNRSGPPGCRFRWSVSVMSHG